MVLAPVWALVHYEEGLWWAALGDTFIQQRLLWTITQALLTCMIALPLSVWCAWVLSHWQFAGRALILRLLMLPFVMPTLVAAMGILALFGANGLLLQNGQDTPYLLLYGNVFFNLPILIRAAYQGFQHIPASRLAAAQTLGASTWQRFCHIESIALLPWLAGGLCLVFLYCFSGFGLALLLGGMTYSTLEVEIYRLITIELDISQAGVLVWLSLGITSLASIAYAIISRVQSRADGKIQALLPSAPRLLRQKMGVASVWLILLVCCVLPLLAVWQQALFAGSSWQVLLEEETHLAIWNTFRFTVLALPLSIVLGVAHAAMAKRFHWGRYILFLPFMVSPVCVAFGIILLYPEWTASLPLLIATYALLAYPFIAKDVLAAWDNLSLRYTAAATNLGANAWQTWTNITLPLLLPALKRGSVLAMATCVGEFAATLFLSRPEWQTLTTLIYRYLGTAGADNRDKAMVLTAVLLLLALCTFVLSDASERKTPSSSQDSSC